MAGTAAFMGPPRTDLNITAKGNAQYSRSRKMFWNGPSALVVNDLLNETVLL
jgi:hypothetical protein